MFNIKYIKNLLTVDLSLKVLNIRKIEILQLKIYPIVKLYFQPLLCFWLPQGPAEYLQGPFRRPWQK